MKTYKVLDNFYFSAWPDAETIEQEQFSKIYTVCKKKLEEGFYDPDKLFYRPLTDGNSIPVGLDEVVDSIVKDIDNNEKVLVHCYLGRNRSALVAAMVLVRKGSTPAEAFQIIKALRPKALYNMKFEEFLTR